MSENLTPFPTIKPGRYRHYKGNEYLFVDLVRHSESLEPMVLYKPLYEGSSLWVRPAGMWSELVNVNGQRVERFAWIGD